jgi:hypothetical protein
MALEDTPSIISYAGNDSTVTAYPLPFVFFSDDDIALYVDGVLSADTFSIIGDKFAGTASAVTDVAYTSSPEQTVTFQREVSYDQPTVLPGSGRTDPTTLERAYDYLSMQIQQVAREVEESPKAAPGDTTPGGSFSEAANTTVGQDANGDLVMRSAAEEVAFLGIGTSVDAAAASAAAALVSETNAATSETNAAASEANAAASEAAAEDALDAIPASLSASNTFTIATNAAVGSILLTFDGGGVFWAGPGDQDEAAQGLADLINAGVHPVTATATGNILRVVAKLPGDDGNGISCVVVVGGGFGSWAGPETTGGSISNLVLTSTQSLTTTQKNQAKENIDLDEVDNTSDADKPISDDTQAALDLKTDLELFNPLSLFSSDHFTLERTIPAEIISRAEHCYIFNEAGGGDYIDLIGGLDIPITGAANPSAAGGRFRETRSFDGSTQYGISAVDTARVGGPFWFVVGVNFTEITGSDGVVGEGEGDVTNTFNWYLYRTGASLVLHVRRKDTTTNFDSVTVAGISAGVDYVVVGRNDSTGLYLYVSEVGEQYDHASLLSGAAGFDTTQYPGSTSQKPGIQGRPRTLV